MPPLPARIPAQARIAEEMRRTPGQGEFIYTTHPFLISLFLSCPPSMGLNCPAPDSLEVFHAAVKRGDITWHAFPFNS